MVYIYIYICITFGDFFVKITPWQHISLFSNIFTSVNLQSSSESETPVSRTGRFSIIIAGSLPMN